MKFTVRRGFDARQWYRSAMDWPANSALTAAIHGSGEWLNDGVVEFDELESVELIGPNGIVLTGDGHGEWWTATGRRVHDPRRR
jgi:hypothetical protein